MRIINIKNTFARRTALIAWMLFCPFVLILLAALQGLIDAGEAIFTGFKPIWKGLR